MSHPDLSAPVVQRRTRFHWMDMLRGAAIVLVMLWHAPAIPVLYGAVMPAPIRAANMFFLPYRMPTLMFLSGLLLPASMRKSPLVYYVGKISLIVWPYILWVTLDRFITGNPHPWYHWRAWYAISYLWFLFFIGVYYAIAPLFKRLPLWVPIALFVSISIVLPPGTEKRLTYFAVFFFVGRLFAHRPTWLNRFASGRWLVLAGGLALAFGVASAILGLGLAYRIQYGLFSLAGIFTLIALARTIDRRGIKLAWLTQIGRNSIVYYASHFPIMVGVMTGLYALGVHNFELVAITNLAVALAGGWLLVRFRSVPPVTWLFALPQTVTSFATRSAQKPALPASRRAVSNG